ncbi:hypothetical protein O6H91_07G110200 [Diphasiastrum complanatum]|uniref:Uncharacterized protein n=1 Tax=Diphasiastrum complanatum TaxID=34168 RepID=A0ACC2D955_DIPCM|nr:hypothetical protein O6H91_07G110200 [Diphasiastrum complanatum]
MEFKRTLIALLLLPLLVNLATCWRYPKRGYRPRRAAIGRFVAGPWSNQAHATFYGTENAAETMGGACGYGNLFQTGYGLHTTALSFALFKEGLGCGGCYEIKCVNSPNCYAGNPAVIVTATNSCPPNWAKPSNNGGWCNFPRQHFDLSKPAFMQIAQWKAGIVPVLYRRVACQKSGGIIFNIQGNYWWLLVYITNVGGAGDIGSVSVKGSRTGWIPMNRNWGAAFQVFTCLRGQALSFRVTSASSPHTVISWNVAPANWQAGSAYSGAQF